ncbi:hypothetical protein BDV18DRAFT_145049 [Aspergillus unguis]
MEKQTVVSNSSDLEAQHIATKEYDSYASVLLEDHPLRDHPMSPEFHPEVSAFTRRWAAFARRRWRERGLPLLCLVLMFFVIIQLLMQLPHLVSYFLAPVHIEKLPGFIQTPTTLAADQGFGNAGSESAICEYEPPMQTGEEEGVGEINGAVESALASGCTGMKADLWLRDHDLLIGESSLDLDHDRTLQSTYLQSLQALLDSRNHASDETREGHETKVDETLPIGLINKDPEQTFTLYLEVQTPMRRAWPVLAEQLKTLNEGGYLSYRDADGAVALRPVTVVVAGRGCRRLSLMNDLTRALKGLF